MEFHEIEYKIRQYREEGKRLFTTSSFQSHSLVLLHIISRIDRNIPVYFINTGFHFPETISFAQQICQDFGLPFVDVKSSTPRHLQKDADGRLLFASDPDFCCYLNKTQPLDTILRSHDIWINGIRADQSATRSAMKLEQPAPHGSMRFHPMLDWDKRKIFAYLREYDLPRNPLDAQGYASIGCEPCTRRLDPDMQEREARWFGLNKTECGLHTDLVTK